MSFILNYSSHTTPLNEILEQKVLFLLFSDTTKTTLLECRMHGDLIETQKIQKIQNHEQLSKLFFYLFWKGNI